MAPKGFFKKLDLDDEEIEIRTHTYRSYLIEIISEGTIIFLCITIRNHKNNLNFYYFQNMKASMISREKNDLKYKKSLPPERFLPIALGRLFALLTTS